MILQHLYGLSDPQVEEQIKDRLSFQKFIQLDAHESVPDETTICRFRQRLIECRLHEQLLEMLNGQLEARGYIVKRTTLVDATIVESSRKRPHPEAASRGTAPDKAPATLAATKVIMATRPMSAAMASITSSGRRCSLRPTPAKRTFLSAWPRRTRKQFMPTRLMTRKPIKPGCRAHDITNASSRRGHSTSS